MKKINVDVMEVEVIDENGNRKKEYFQNDLQSPVEFLQKRKRNYQNEYSQAKKLFICSMKMMVMMKKN